jgi:hypothetical protein
VLLAGPDPLALAVEDVVGEPFLDQLVFSTPREMKGPLARPFGVGIQEQLTS